MKKEVLFKIFEDLEYDMSLNTMLSEHMDSLDMQELKILLEIEGYTFPDEHYTDVQSLLERIEELEC